jgi:hypothetical protein
MGERYIPSRRRRGIKISVSQAEQQDGAVVDSGRIQEQEAESAAQKAQVEVYLSSEVEMYKKAVEKRKQHPACVSTKMK